MHENTDTYSKRDLLSPQEVKLWSYISYITVTGLWSCQIVNNEITFASANKAKDTMPFKQCVKIISHG